MNAKYKKGTIIYTDYFSEPGKLESFEILCFTFDGSRVVLSLYNPRTCETYRYYNKKSGYLSFNIKKYNKLFFTKNEIRANKLKNLRS